MYLAPAHLAAVFPHQPPSQCQHIRLPHRLFVGRLQLSLQLLHFFLQGGVLLFQLLGGFRLFRLLLLLLLLCQAFGIFRFLRGCCRSRSCISVGRYDFCPS